MSQSEADKNLNNLINLYRKAKDDQMALFLGSGVNGGIWAKSHPACASWPMLLTEAGKHFHSMNHLEAILKLYGHDWINAADKIFHRQDRRKVVEMIDEAIYLDVFYDLTKRRSKLKKHKVLPWRILKKMKTLCATVGFTAAINDPSKKCSMRRNPKVGRVLTSNYDFFFGAAWPRYTSMSKSWWPVTWASTALLKEGTGPIIYLHGYLPYDGNGERDVIIMNSDYTRAYKKSGAKQPGFAWSKLTDAVFLCNLIFIGFSFSDDRVNEILKHSGHSKKHFAFIHASEIKTIKVAKEVGVFPITLESWTQLPKMLSQIYCTGLTEKELIRSGMTNSQYWGVLQEGLKPRQSRQILNKQK